MTGDQTPLGPQFEEEDEDLPTVSPRRLRIDLLLGAAVLVAVLVAGRALAGHGGKHGAAPTPSVAPSPVATSTAPAPVPPRPSQLRITRGNGAVELVPALPPRTTANPAACPLPTCATVDSVPPGVLDAINAVFPDNTVLFTISVRLPDHPWDGALWFRQVNLVVNGSQFLLRVYAPGPSDDVASGTTSDGVVYYRAEFLQYIVAVQLGPGAGGTLDKLRTLAHDERLLAP